MAGGNAYEIRHTVKVEHVAVDSPVVEARFRFLAAIYFVPRDIAEYDAVVGALTAAQTQGTFVTITVHGDRVVNAEPARQEQE